jgi:pimeloyl-ACP methyl ester carboxylesterase
VTSANPAKKADSIELDTLTGGAFSAQTAGDRAARIREWLAEGTITPERMTDYVIQGMQAYRMGAYWYGHAAAFAYHHEEPLTRLTMPVMLLSNTGDQTHPWAQTARGMYPHFAYAEIEGGGIDICDQAPEAWAQAIVDFVNSVG